jgi:hypothetical protein
MNPNQPTDSTTCGTRTYQLQYLSMFGGLERDQLQALLALAEWVEVGLGDSLTPHLGDGEVIVVVCGALELVANRVGEPHRILGRGSARPGRSVDERLASTITALTPVTLMRLSAEAIEELATRHANIWGRISDAVARDNQLDGVTRAA